MTDMHNEIQRKEGIIEQLKQLIEVLKQRERERDAPIGLVIIQFEYPLRIFQRLPHQIQPTLGYLNEKKNSISNFKRSLADKCLI